MSLMPLSQEGGIDQGHHAQPPDDFETVDKLRFVLNREIEVALAPKQAIVEAINHYYGGVDQGDRVGRLDAPGIHRHRPRLQRGLGRRRSRGACGTGANVLDDERRPRSSASST